MGTNRIRSSDATSLDAVPVRSREFSRQARSPSAGARDGRETEVILHPEIPRILGRHIGTRTTAFGLVTLAAMLALPAAVFAQGAGQPSGSHSSGSATGGSVWMDLAVVFVLLVVSLVFVLIETALLTVRRTRIEQLVEEGNRSARIVQQLLSEPTRMLATLQVGLTLVQLFSAGEAANRFVGPAQKLLISICGDQGFAARYSQSISFISVIFTMALLTLVVGEIVPKSIGIRFAEVIALRVGWMIRWLEIVLHPIVSLVTVLANLMVRPFGGTASFHSAAMSEEELKIMVEQSEEHGVIETEEKEMIHKVFEFADTVVRKVMTPRLDVTAIEADVTVDDLIESVTNSGHSRLPVFDDNLDNIVGIVHVKDVLAGITSRTKVSIRDLMRPPYFIPENKRVDDLLTEFRRNKTQIAVVRDEYGTVVGIVTIEDLVEEIFGDIQDEYDVEEPQIRQVDSETCIVDGLMSVDDFNDRMGVELPTEESDTLGGFLFGLLGHQPAKGETAAWGGLDLQVEETDGRRIQRIRVCRRSGGTDENIDLLTTIQEEPGNQ